MSWNYRILRVDYVFEGKTTPEFSIHRCFYSNSTDTLPSKWSVSPAAPEGETLEELRADLVRFMEAFEKPVLAEKRGKLIQYHNSELEGKEK